MNGQKAHFIIALVRIWCWLAYPRQTIDFRLKIGRWPDPAFPRYRNDKFAWRKIFDRNPMFTVVSDKLKAKEFARHHCRGLKVARTLWVGNDASQIPDEVLQGNVIVKGNHGSGWNIVIRDGQYDREELNRQANTWLNRRYGKRHAEWGYYGVEPKLFVEEMLFEQGQPLANEYKFYAGSRKIAFAFVRQSGSDGTRIDGVIDAFGVVHKGQHDNGELSPDIKTPAEYSALCRTALKLSSQLDFVRCDLYLVEGQIYFSEMTLYGAGGYDWENFAPADEAKIDEQELNQLYSEVWDLRQSWFMKTPQKGWRKTYALALRTLLDTEE